MPSIDTSISIVTLADVKTFIEGSTTGTTQFDGNYNMIINQVSGFFNTYCNRTFKANDYTTYLDGNGSSELQLDRYPISTTGVAVNIDWYRNFTTDTVVSTSTITVYNDEGRITLLSRNFGSGLRSIYRSYGSQSIKVDYNAGYSSSSIPYDLQHAALEMCQFWFDRNTKKNRIGIRNESMEGMSRTFETDIPWSVKMILDYYASSRYY